MSRLSPRKNRKRNTAEPNSARRGLLRRWSTPLCLERLEDRLAPAFGVPLLNVPGQGFTGPTPPDTVGDVGVFHYLQAVNDPGGTMVTIYNKATGTAVGAPFNLSSLAPARLSS